MYQWLSTFSLEQKNMVVNTKGNVLEQYSRKMPRNIAKEIASSALLNI